MASGKKPKRRGEKADLAAAPSSTDGDHPWFCLGCIQSKFGVAHLSAAQQSDLAKTLEQRSSLTWREIKRAGKHGQGTELMPVREFHPDIPSAFADRDQLMVFRYSGKLPMAGVRIGRVFHILWISGKYGELYDHS